jgi:Uma2 family endonuclease
MATTKQMTAHELFELDDDDYRHERIGGVATPLPLAIEVESRALTRLCASVGVFLDQNPIGHCYVGNPGILFDAALDTVLAPDLAFFRGVRAAMGVDRSGYLAIAPDLVVEMISPLDRAVHFYAKLGIYHKAGVQLIWTIDPVQQLITVYAAGGAVTFVEPGGTLDGGEVLPGFSLAVSELFRY